MKCSELATKDFSGDRQLDVVVRNGGNHVAGIPKPITQSVYQYVEHVMEFDPSTGAVWNVAGFNSRQIGPDLVV